MKYINYTFMKGVAVLSDEYMSVSEFANRVGVAVSTLYNWDKSGKLKPHHRTIGGKRVYSSGQVQAYLSGDLVCKDSES